MPRILEFRHIEGQQMKKHVIFQVCAASAVAAIAFWAGTMRNGTSSDDKNVSDSKSVRRVCNLPMRVMDRPVPAAVNGNVIDVVRDGDGVRSEQNIQESRTEEGVLTSIREILTALDEGRLNEDEAARRIRALRTNDDTALLLCLSNMTSAPDDNERCRAYALIGTAYGSDGKPIVVDLDADPDSPEVRFEANRTHKLVDMVGRGLCDRVASVRDAAFEAFSMLDGDAASVLARQILAGEDTEMKLRLMDATANTITGQAIGISLDALGNADETVRAAASKNIAAVTGKTFSSQEEARDWWEENSTDFLTKAYCGANMEAVTIEEPPETGLSTTVTTTNNKE